MSARGDKRRRRADGELGEEQETDRQQRPNEYYLKGVYKAKPADFGDAWPGVRTETLVEMVFDSIKRLGHPTYEDILRDTKIQEQRLGVALADLTLWRGDVKTEELGERVYVAVRDELTRIPAEERERFYRW